MESLCPTIAVAGSSLAANSFKSVCSAPRSYMRGNLTSASSLTLQTSFCLPSGVSRCVRYTYAAATSLDKVDEVEKEMKSKQTSISLAPNSFEIQSLIMEVCDETSIAELELKIGAFKLHMKRDVGKLKDGTPAVPVVPPVSSKPLAESGPPVAFPPVVASQAPKSPASTAAILANSASKLGSKFGLLKAAADEGLHFVTSPKVGLFRRSRIVKGKSGRPLCEEGQIVKEGQVVCYVEQLGTQQPVEAENSGEVMKILCKDGEPLGYGDPLIAIRPSFPGIN